MTLVPIYLLVQNAFKNASFIVKNSNKYLQGGLFPLCPPPPGCVLSGWEKKDFLERGGGNDLKSEYIFLDFN